MSYKNCPAAAVNDDRHLHVVSDDPGKQNAPTTEDKVRTALADNPGSTTAKLAMGAGVGRSTAAKILARWGRDGTAIRTASESPSNPATWTLATSEDAVATPDIEDAQPDATATTSNIDQLPGRTSGADDAATEAAVTEEAIDDAVEANEAQVEPAITPQSASNDTADAVSTDTEAGDHTAPPTGAEAVEHVDPGKDVTETSLETPRVVAESSGIAPVNKDRLSKGGLRALVEEYLTERPGESFGPAKIGKDLSRSGGAVNNALEKLVTDGYVTKTCEAPKRFTINLEKTDLPTITK